MDVKLKELFDQLMLIDGQIYERAKILSAQGKMDHKHLRELSKASRAYKDFWEYVSKAEVIVKT